MQHLLIPGIMIAERKISSDLLGASASTLCIIHCLATPLIFVAQACTVSCCASAPAWWKIMDVGFLLFAAIAIYWSVQNTSVQWIKVGFAISWVLLFALITNNYVSLVSIPHTLVYLPAFSLVGLHLYNRRYCQCAEDSCCSETVLANQ